MTQFILQAAEGFQAQAVAQPLDGQDEGGEGGGGEHVELQVVAPDYNFFQCELARMKEAADMLHEQAAATKEEMRKGNIAASISTIKSAAGKRTGRICAVSEARSAVRRPARGGRKPIPWLGVAGSEPTPWLWVAGS